MDRDEISRSGSLFGRLERELGIPENWLFTLVKDSDWSFIIKLHALFEAALTHLLEAELQKPGLKRFISRINIRGQVGKLEMARALELVNRTQFRYVDMLSDMRNACVHDVRNVVDFKLSDYAVNDNDQRNMIELVRANSAPGADLGQIDEIMRRNVKTAVWLAGINAVAVMYNKKEHIAAMAQATKRILQAHRPRLDTVDDLADWDSMTLYGDDLKRE